MDLRAITGLTRALVVRMPGFCDSSGRDERACDFSKEVNADTESLPAETSLHKPGHFKLLPSLLRGEPALGAVCNQLLLTQAPFPRVSLCFINKHLILFLI